MPGDSSNAVPFGRRLATGAEMRVTGPTDRAAVVCVNGGQGSEGEGPWGAPARAARRATVRRHPGTARPLAPRRPGRQSGQLAPGLRARAGSGCGGQLHAHSEGGAWGRVPRALGSPDPVPARRTLGGRRLARADAVSGLDGLSAAPELLPLV